MPNQSFKIRDIRTPNPGAKGFKRLQNFFGFFVGSLEFAVILGAWLIIFFQAEEIAGLGREAMLSYVLVANIVGMVSGKLLGTLIEDEAAREKVSRLISQPFRFFARTFFKHIGLNFLPLLAALSFNLLALYLLLGSLPFVFEPVNIILALVTGLLAFFIEILLFYWSRVFVFWQYEMAGVQKIWLRFKKILAGAYFPLSILPGFLFPLCLYLPFAYTFFVPAELLQDKLDIGLAVRGIAVEILWIFLLYFSLRYYWRKQRA